VRNSLIAVGVAVVALAVALSLLARGCGATPSVTVPRVTGVPVDQATNTLHGQGLRADVTKAHSTQPTGNVTHQDPGPHVQAAQGSTVQLTVSSGPQLVDVDASDYLGKSYDDVNGDLKDKGLAVSRHDEAISGKTPGTVVAVNPHGKVRKGTNITVTVAVAPAQPTSQPGNGPHHDNGKHKGEHKNNGNNGNGPGTPSPPSPPMTPSPPMQPSPPGGDDNDQGQD
jgi:serine/threonine-protein kinase